MRLSSLPQVLTLTQGPKPCDKLEIVALGTS